MWLRRRSREGGYWQVTRLQRRVQEDGSDKEKKGAAGKRNGGTEPHAATRSSSIGRRLGLQIGTPERDSREQNPQASGRQSATLHHRITFRQARSRTHAVRKHRPDRRNDDARLCSVRLVSVRTVDPNGPCRRSNNRDHRNAVSLLAAYTPPALRTCVVACNELR
ncbi:hypothetical protein PHSY_003349 [Pseudozyma hubeiensis SY62]|uniref:Uncharacterized protein n=1 Tax=Pseudozyma hubeiensis (strain SY62) TaxID=1305764 RepID=R9P2X1_PSEHS|nr:hypothetical protein PHSY_003349 [Pseudozyma hubeiensis SY62]GAC95773.1 hypothetical protein PHSY_003349 [Pseudozyma hubeiensis SY62]